MGAALVLMAGAAHSQCAPASMMAWKLANSYGEAVTEETILDHDGAQITVQLWTAGERKSWSVVAIHGNTACLLAAGKTYQGQALAHWLVGVRA